MINERHNKQPQANSPETNKSNKNKVKASLAAVAVGAVGIVSIAHNIAPGNNEQAAEYTLVDHDSAILNDGENVLDVVNERASLMAERIGISYSDIDSTVQPSQAAAIEFRTLEEGRRSEQAGDIVSVDLLKTGEVDDVSYSVDVEIAREDS